MGEERRVTVFVDASNLYHSLNRPNLSPHQIDYAKLFGAISNRDNPRVRFYTAPKLKQQGLEQQKHQQKFFDELKSKNKNLTIHFGRLQIISSNYSGKQQTIHALNFCKNCVRKAWDLTKAFGNYNRFREKGVDVLIAVDLVDLAEKDEYDIAILVSGDSDLVPAVKLVVFKGKKIINGYFELSSGKELRDACSSQFHISDDILKRCKF